MDEPSRREGQWPSDASKNAEALHGTGALLAELVDRYAGILYWLAWSVLEDSRAAEEVLDGTFLLARSRPIGSQQGDFSFPWLARTAIQEALERLRIRDARMWKAFGETMEAVEASIPKEVADWAEDAEQRYDGEELKQLVREAVRTLTPASRVVFLLHDVAKLSSQETSQLLGISLADVRMRTLRGRMQLREQLDPHFRLAVGGTA